MRILSKILAPALLAVALGAGLAAAQSGPAKPNVAVQEFQAVGATPVEAEAITDKLREELVRGGKMVMVERAQMGEILAKQAEQQAACSGGASQCSVKIGKILGVRLMISGKVIKFGTDAWQVSATVVDVETAQTLKAESVRYRGDVMSLAEKAMPELAAKLGS